MTTEKSSTAVVSAVDGDNWESTKNEKANRACPNNNPFIYIPTTLNGVQNSKTKWWTNYWWGLNEWHEGTYIGDPKFRSDFDPKKFYKQLDDGTVKLTAFWDKNRRNPSSNQPDPCWITAELVCGGMDGTNDYFYGTYGHYAVIVSTEDFGSFDPGVCFGVFTYQFGKAADPDEGRRCENVNREIDLLETISTAQQKLHGNAQFALQPASPDQPDGKSLLRFTIPKGTPTVTAYMYWGDPLGLETTKIRLYAGDHTISSITHDKSLKALAEWDVGNFDSDNGHAWYANVPKPKHQRMHINLYVPGANDIANKEHVNEVIIKRFEYSHK